MASTRRTVAAIAESSMAEANAKAAEDQARSRPTGVTQVDGAVQVASNVPEPVTLPPERPARSLITASNAALPPKRPISEPAALTSGVIKTQPIDAVPGATEPMKPVRVKTVQVKAKSVRLASAGPAPSVSPAADNATADHDWAPETGLCRSAGECTAATCQLRHRSGHIGRAPRFESSVFDKAGDGSCGFRSRGSTADRSEEWRAQTVASHSGWIIQVGALETESQARERLDTARGRAPKMLGKADPFTEFVGKGNKKLYRARFAGLDRDEAEAACRTLKRSDISCITIKN